MFKDTYQHMTNRITPSEGLMNRTRAAMQPRRRSFAPRRALAFTLAMILCLGIGTSALAASSADFNDWLYAIFPGWAMYFRPVQLSCEDQGLRLEVTGIHIMGRQADILITLQDLTGDRLDESLDLFDSYSLDTPGDSSATCEFVGYDAESRSAAFRIRYTAQSNIHANKLTFSLRRLLTGKEATATKLYLPLAEYSTAPETQLIGSRLRGWGGSAALDRDSVAEQLVLLPGEEIMPLASGVNLTAAGYLNGKLRVQLLYEDILRTDNHGFLWLEDVHGNRLESTASVAFWAENKTDSYEEYFFDASPEAVQGYALCGDFTTCEQLIEGDWTITFPITDM